MLLPDIRALGGDDSTFEPFVPPYEPVSLPAPVSRLKRRLILARLVEKWLETRTDFPFSAPALGGHRGRPNSAEVLAQVGDRRSPAAGSRRKSCAKIHGTSSPSG